MISLQICRESFSRSTSDRASSKRKLRTEMISKPQNDFKHTGHVGIDGASFGDIAFLGSSQNVSAYMTNLRLNQIAKGTLRTN